MTVIENTPDRLLLRDAIGTYHFQAFHKIRYLWALTPFLITGLWFELSFTDSRFWVTGSVLAAAGLMSFALWFWRLEIELTKNGMRISERFLVRKNREISFPFHSIKEARFHSVGIQRRLVLIVKSAKQHVIASGLFEETLRASAVSINEFIKKHPGGYRPDASTG